MTVVYYICELLLIKVITNYEATKNNKINHQARK
jgi:hypothetical protein